ncbi:alpha/beta hydrolase [Umezawaea sp.]|uniref:alpha/beta fold hydrolase n=1 Tax=Umezawaea sp. TaxID=1955258 RepID=UPI002ECFD1E4
MVRYTTFRLTLVGAVAVLLCTLGCTAAGQSPGAGDPTSSAPAFDAATRGDEEFNRLFTHRFAEVDGVRLHYVAGGTGDPLVLLHGWPQTWYAWRGVMPALAERYTVYALDLPGLGDSTGSPTGYDKATLARYVHGLLADELGLRDVRLVGHDLGAGVGARYASQYPDEVVRYAHLDYPLPGPALSAATYRTFSWHMAFHDQEGIPEMLVDDDVREYLASFYPLVAHGGVSFGGAGAASPFSEEQVDEFARTYRRPEVLSGGFDLYRTLDQDERDNAAARPVAVPTMVMAAEGTLASARPTVEPLFSAVERAVEVPGSGHWLPEENPEFVTRELLDFLAGP